MFILSLDKVGSSWELSMIFTKVGGPGVNLSQYKQSSTYLRVGT